ncbi:hypothetical protein QMA02_30130 [Bacillus wiedmannii]|nr:MULTISPECIES: hypothetical protein [Bacillus cereus group]MDI6680020.1 hypothetical protein [Bacillus wiedmannii]MED1383690.1 hypothetical protein [Bacillus mycoides]
MKKLIFGLMSIVVITLTLGSTDYSKAVQLSADEVVQYSHGHTGG